MIERTFGRKIALSFAVASILGSVAVMAVFLVMLVRHGIGDVIVASLLASILFLLSCGVVLYLISKPPRHALLPWDHGDPKISEAAAAQD